jgi:hypothetical protein
VWIAVGVLLLGVIGLVTLAAIQPRTPVASAPSAPTSPSVVGELAAIPAATFDEVGGADAGTSLTLPVVADSEGATPPPAGTPPEVLFVGSEFCPFCAAERWPLVVALARFGTFQVLHDTVSADASVFPSIQTFTFDGVRYSSPYVSLDGIELYSNQVGSDRSYLPLAHLTPAQSDLIAAASPRSSAGSPPVPFLDIGGKMSATSSGVSPALFVGLSLGQIADQVTHPPPPVGARGAVVVPSVGRAILAAANQVTAGICLATDQRPAKVCRSSGVRQADAVLGITTR